MSDKPKRERDVPGDAMASAAAVTRRLVAVAEQLYRSERILTRNEERDIYLLGVRFKAPQGDDHRWLGVITAWVEGKRMVGFVQDEVFAECARMVWAQLENDTVRWQDDKFSG